jgi:hypothetical protein
VTLIAFDGAANFSSISFLMKADQRERKVYTKQLVGGNVWFLDRNVGIPFAFELKLLALTLKH